MHDFDDHWRLGWWSSIEAPQKMQGTLIFMLRVADNVLLAIPGVSIAYAPVNLKPSAIQYYASKLNSEEPMYDERRGKKQVGLPVSNYVCR